MTAMIGGAVKVQHLSLLRWLMRVQAPTMCVKITEKYVCFLEDFSFWKPFEFDECVKMDGCKNGPSNKGWLLCDAPRAMKELHRSSSWQVVAPSIEPAGPPTNGKPMVFTTASWQGQKSTNGHWLFLVPIKGGIFPANWGIIYGTDPTY